jgi:hypothetical protein
MKTNVFLVLGSEGNGNSGHAIFGIYPTPELANARCAAMEEAYADGEDGAEFMWVTSVEVGAWGADCNISVD